MYSKSVRKSAIGWIQIKNMEISRKDPDPKPFLLFYVLCIPPYGDAGEDEVYGIASHFLMS